MPDRDTTEFVGVVVAAGRSTRFGGEVPKQFALLAGRPLLEWAVEALAGRPGVRGVVVVLPPGELAGKRAKQVRGWPGVIRLVAGGETRARSVRRGLEVAGSAPFVLVHDAARPLAGAALVESVMEATRRCGAAVPVVEVRDTVKRVGRAGRIEETLDRASLRLAQTPQGARTDWLLEALEHAERDGVRVTDEAAALEREGRPVEPVAGDPQNAKITSPEDLAEARRRLAGEAPALRVGHGYDIHPFDPDRPLLLGGLRFEGQPGLGGHSDADVVLHAAMDALLGAAGLGDIGRRFPPGDARFAGAASTGLAAEVARALADRGFEIVNLDLTVLAERPRIGERAEAMRESIARCLGVEPGRIGLKATTLEGLGPLGRGEGIACHAIALIRRGGAT